MLVQCENERGRSTAFFATFVAITIDQCNLIALFQHAPVKVNLDILSEIGRNVRAFPTSRGDAINFAWRYNWPSFAEISTRSTQERGFPPPYHRVLEYLINNVAEQVHIMNVSSARRARNPSERPFTPSAYAQLAHAFKWSSLDSFSLQGSRGEGRYRPRTSNERRVPFSRPQ